MQKSIKDLLAERIAAQKEVEKAAKKVREELEKKKEEKK